MGVGWETYGRQYGLTQEQWDAIPQAQKDAIKAGGPASADIARSYASSPSLGMGGGTGSSAITYGAAPETYSEPTYDDGSGSGSYSGGGGAVAPMRVLAESPEWLAYLNALDLEQNQFRADIDKQKALYQSESDRQLQDLPVGYQQQRRGISGSMETRGMSRSGEFLRKLAENRASQGRAEGAIKGQTAFQMGSLESQLAQKLMSLQSQKAQQELQLRSQGYI